MMNNVYVILTFLIFFISCLIFMVKKKMIWEDTESDYSNSFSLKAFIFLVGIIIILVIRLIQKI
ncbi:hypothetical protein B0O44_105347 [Pedobacter nutrimenti]|uniref:Uncharacterized protein n=1 Tax=Pedobacter nutrimenti TaxID=1241337 RepID=A0A318UCJ8_9SPHI|nr:hypothetical protein B0O44_105347 [Pedobacter nutrimenti]